MNDENVTAATAAAWKGEAHLWLVRGVWPAIRDLRADEIRCDSDAYAKLSAGAFEIRFVGRKVVPDAALPPGVVALWRGGVQVWRSDAPATAPYEAALLALLHESDREPFLRDGGSGSG